MPNLEIFIPTYNRSSSIGHLLQSICHPSNLAANCSYYILDDASTDSTWSVIESYSATLTRLYPGSRIKKNSCNLGFAKNLVDAIVTSISPHVLYIADDDDISFANIDSLVHLVGLSSAAVFSCAWGSKASDIPAPRHPKHCLISGSRVRHFLSHLPGTVFSVPAFRSLEPDVSTFIANDAYLAVIYPQIVIALLAMARGMSLISIPIQIGSYRITGNLPSHCTYSDGSGLTQFLDFENSSQLKRSSGISSTHHQRLYPLAEILFLSTSIIYDLIQSTSQSLPSYLAGYR